MDRRKFIKDSMAVAAMVAASPVLNAQTKTKTKLLTDDQPDTNQKLITSAPMLQNYAPTSIGIAFAVSSNANGYIKIADNPQMTEARFFPKPAAVL